MSEHDIPLTPEVRREFAAVGARQCVDLGLRQDTVEAWEDGYRTIDEPTSFEWWYFDTQGDDGSSVVVTLSTKPHTHPDGPLRPLVLVIRRTADGTSSQRTIPFAAGDFEAVGGRDGHCDVRIGPNWIRGDLASYDLHVETDEATIDLRLERVGPSWRPGSGHNYFGKDKSSYLAWVVPCPYATVTGTVTPADGPAVAFTGFGYHDHNWGNTPMGKGLDHWYWGRARAGDYTLIYTQMTTRGFFSLAHYHLPVFYVAKGDRILTDDGLSLTLELQDIVDGPHGRDYPTRLVWRWRRNAGNDPDGDPATFGDITLTVTDVHLIETLDMTEDMPGWRRRIERLVHNPLYYDFDARAELTVHFQGIDETVEGRTLFEKMMLR